jgi:hypothetical protein|tara:strand:- start:379 stop:561 length:183 start_codon:yes stop_codon:yes gene_type:complete
MVTSLVLNREQKALTRELIKELKAHIIKLQVRSHPKTNTIPSMETTKCQIHFKTMVLVLE